MDTFITIKNRSTLSPKRYQNFLRPTADTPNLCPDPLALKPVGMCVYINKNRQYNTHFILNEQATRAHWIYLKPVEPTL